MNKSKFAVGDKVVLNYRKHPVIGKVIKVNDEKGDISVDFNGTMCDFDLYTHYSKSWDEFYGCRIELLTPEIKQSIQDDWVIAKCVEMMKNATSINADQAARIIAILEEKHNENQY